MNEMYEVKLQAASLSIFSPNKLQISEATSPKQVSMDVLLMIDMKILGNMLMREYETEPSRKDSFKIVNG